MTLSLAAFFVSPAILAASTVILAIEGVLFIQRRRERRRLARQPLPRLGSVLVADDQAVVREAVCLALQRRGYQTVSVDGGAAAEAALAGEGAAQFDAAVFDVMMPGPSVSDLVALARRQHPGFPVVLMSGSELRPTVDPILAQGNARFLRKPMTPDQLAMSLQELMPTTSAERTAVRIVRTAMGISIFTLLN